MWETLPTDEVVVIGVNAGGLFGSDVPQLELIVGQQGLTFPIVIDAGGSYSNFSAGPGISPFPLDVVVDSDGTIAWLSRKYDAAALMGAVEALRND